MLQKNAADIVVSTIISQLNWFMISNESRAGARADSDSGSASASGSALSSRGVLALVSTVAQQPSARGISRFPMLIRNMISAQFARSTLSCIQVEFPSVVDKVQQAFVGPERVRAALKNSIIKRIERITYSD